MKPKSERKYVTIPALLRLGRACVDARRILKDAKTLREAYEDTFPFSRGWFLVMLEGGDVATRETGDIEQVGSLVYSSYARRVRRALATQGYRVR